MAASATRFALINIALALLLAAGAFWAFTRSNDFPVGYHPDEQGKAQQIIDVRRSRNFNQPLLMVEAANVVRECFGVPGDVRTVVIAGRYTSAAMASLAVFALALAGGWPYGAPGILLCGVMMGLCPALLVYAHYFKEDTSLIAGIAVALLGARFLVNSRATRRQLFGAAILAVGCAIAISAKYVGGVVLIPCLLAVLIAPMPTRWIMPVRLLAFVTVASAAVLAINARAFAGFIPPHMLPVAYQQMKAEFAHGTTGHDYLALATPNLYCLRIAFSELMPHVWLFLVIGAAGFIAGRKITRWGMAVAAFLGILIAALSLDTIPFGRYALPLTVMLYFIAAQWMTLALSALPRRVPWLICMGLIIAAQGLRCVNFTNQFADDSRQRLRQWMAKNLEPGVTVVADRYIVLDGPGDRWRFPDQLPLQIEMTHRALAADGAATVEQLAADGIQYVAVADTNYERFIDPQIHALFPREGDLLRRRQFYLDLFSRGELIWASKPSVATHAYVNPELRLYRISRLAGG